MKPALVLAFALAAVLRQRPRPPTRRRPSRSAPSIPCPATPRALARHQGRDRACGQIVNEAHPELGDLTLAAGGGLPNLGGAGRVVFADNQGSPAAGQNQALRLITEEKVVALTGAYQSSVP